MQFLDVLPFGSPINFESPTPNKPPCEDPDYKRGADEMVSQFVNIKHFYRDRLRETMSGTPHEPHAIRFYCTDDCAFIFDVSYLEAIVKAIRKNTNPALTQDGCMILFNGLREENPGQPGCTFGRPTAIVTAYAETADRQQLKHVQIQYPDSLNPLENLCDGAEHPGDGSSPSSFLFTKGQNKDLLNNTNQQNNPETERTEAQIVDDKPLVLDKKAEGVYSIRKDILLSELKVGWTQS